MFTPITTRQIDPFCVPLQMSAENLLADHNGGSVSGYLHSTTRRWPPGSPGYGPNVWSADLNIYTSPSRGTVVRICRGQGRAQAAREEIACRSQ
jgi:hypothetical protein